MAKTTNLPTVRELRKIAEAQRVRIHRQGGQWIKSVYSPATGCWHEQPMHYSHDNDTERQALAAALCIPTE